MRCYYLETSALAKLYVREAGSEAMLRLLNSGGGQWYVASLTRVELRSALRRLHRAGALRADALAAAIAAFDDDSRLFSFQAATEAILECAVRLVDTYPLRAYDAIQLATCVFMAASGTAPSAPVFVCSDLELLQAAQGEGLETFDPAVQSAP